MNLREKMAGLQVQLKDAREKAEGGDAEAIAMLGDLVDEVEKTKAAIEKADEARALLNSLGGGEGPADLEDEPKAAKSLGEHAAIAMKRSGYTSHDKFGLSTTEFKAASAMTLPSTVGAATTDVDTRIVEGYRRPLLVADLFGSESISGNAITFYVESATVEGGVGTVSEGAVKPLTSFGDPTAKTVALQKIGAHYKESSELVEDTPWLASSINGRGMYLHELYVENYLLSQLAATSGIQVINKTKTQGLAADDLFDAMTKVQTGSGFQADAIVINPADYQELRLAKDGNGQYYGGGYFYGLYGQQGVQEQPPLWGLRTVVTSAVAKGTAYVGAFNLGGSVIRKGGVSVNIANTNEDDFIKNVITILIEERLALAVRYPAAFAKIAVASE